MKKNGWAWILSVVGVLFSGYLSYSKIILGVCPVKENCPYLFGYPICVYGLVLFIVLLLSSSIYHFKKDLFNKKIMIGVSFIGILFSLYYAVYDFVTCSGCTYSLLLPTCVYGFFVYLFIFIISRKR